MKSIIYCIFLVFFLKGNIYSQIEVRKGEHLFDKLMGFSNKFGELQKDSKAIFVFFPLYVDNFDSIKYVNERELTQGIYYYRVAGFHFSDHIFIVYNKGNIKILSYGKEYRKFIKTVCSYCDKMKDNKEKYACLNKVFEFIYKDYLKPSAY